MRHLRPRRLRPRCLPQQTRAQPGAHVLLGAAHQRVGLLAADAEQAGLNGWGSACRRNQAHVMAAALATRLIVAAALATRLMCGAVAQCDGDGGLSEAL
jgi:hypothetical protein